MTTMSVIRYVFPLLSEIKLTREQKRRKTKSNNDLSPAVRDKMKKAFAECYRAVLACEDEHGRKRCELFRDLPDKRVRVFGAR
jgi:ATP-dependent helicase STH1/SNF2